MPAGARVGVVLADGSKRPGRHGRARGRRLVARRLAGWRPSCGPQCGRSRARCWRCAWIRRRRCVSHVLWAPGVYLVPRRDGRLLIGATVEEKGFDTTLTAGGLLTLLEAAWRAVPAVEELPIDETWVGHRPGSRDDAPILGPGAGRGPCLRHRPSSQRNSADAGHRGHDRAPVLDGVVDPAIRPFGIERFCRRGRPPPSRTKLQEDVMTEAAVAASIRVNGEDEPFVVATLAALLDEKAVDTAQRGIAVALNGSRRSARGLAANAAAAGRQRRDRARPARAVDFGESRNVRSADHCRPRVPLAPVSRHRRLPEPQGHARRGGGQRNRDGDRIDPSHQPRRRGRKPDRSDRRSRSTSCPIRPAARPRRTPCSPPSSRARRSRPTGSSSK